MEGEQAVLEERDVEQVVAVALEVLRAHLAAHFCSPLRMRSPMKVFHLLEHLGLRANLSHELLDEQMVVHVLELLHGLQDLGS